MKDNTQIAVRIFDNHAQEYQERYMDVSVYHDTLDFFCNAIDVKNPQILELACGPGNITKYLLEQRPDFKILGTDLSPKMLQLAKANNPNATFQLFDSRKLHKIDTSYDAIVFGFGLPYLSKEEAITCITNAAQLLTSNGVLYLSTMEGNYAQSGWQEPSSGKGERIYVHYHEASYLLECITTNHLVILDTQRITYPDQKGDMITDLIIIARTSSSNQKLK